MVLSKVSIGPSRRRIRFIPYSASLRGLVRCPSIALAMEHILKTRSPRTLTAIAAVLVISATPVLAQETAAPSAASPSAANAQVPQTSPAPPPATPGTAPSTVTTSMPVVQNAQPRPEDMGPSGGTETPAGMHSATTPERAKKIASPVKAPAASPVVPQTSRGDKRAGPLAQGAAPIPQVEPAPASQPAPVASAPVVARPAAPVAPSDSTNELSVAGAAALLAALAVAGASALAISLRRRRTDDLVAAAETEPAPLYMKPSPAPLAQEDPVTPEGLVPLATVPMAPQATSYASRNQVAASTGETSLSIMGTGPVPVDPDERSALVERMVAAAPDAENPFTTAKARRRRARLLLNRHERELGQEKPFDWRTYQPSSQAAASAAREKVDA